MWKAVGLGSSPEAVGESGPVAEDAPLETHNC